MHSSWADGWLLTVSTFALHFCAPPMVRNAVLRQYSRIAHQPIRLQEPLDDMPGDYLQREAV